jgi:hypothetical protein
VVDSLILRSVLVEFLGRELVDFHFHDVRHDFATRIRRSGQGLDLVQKLLGHASPALTQRYGHIRAPYASGPPSGSSTRKPLPPLCPPGFRRALGQSRLSAGNIEWAGRDSNPGPTD